MPKLFDSVPMDRWIELRTKAVTTKPQASIERAMGYLAKHERDIGPETGDALAILWKAHEQVMRARQAKPVAITLNHTEREQFAIERNIERNRPHNWRFDPCRKNRPEKSRTDLRAIRQEAKGV